MEVSAPDGESNSLEEAPLVMAKLGSGKDGSEALPSDNVHRSAWWQTMTILVGEVMGTGVLSLPYACSKLGWALGLVSAIFFAFTAIYSSLLLSRIKNRFYPEAVSYADVARLIHGPVVERLGPLRRHCYLVHALCLLSGCGRHHSGI